MYAKMLAWLLFAITAIAVVRAPNQTNGFNQTIGFNQPIGFNQSIGFNQTIGSNQTGFNTTALNDTNGSIPTRIPPGNQVENEPHRINGSNATAPNNGDGTNVANGTWPMVLFGKNPILDNSFITANATAVAIRHKRSFDWWDVLIKLLKGLGGIGTFLLDLGKDLIIMVAKTATEKLLEQAFRKDCETVAKTCTCGWGACHINPGAVASACCREDYSYTCCQKAPQLIDVCREKCKCGWGSCFPSPGVSVRNGDCCERGYAWVCCDKPPPPTTPAPVLKGCEKNQNKCPKDCTWGACHPQEGAIGDDCCKADYIYKCCEGPPPVLKGCQKKQSECPKDCTWGACHPHEGAIGDECCKPGYVFKCCEEAPKKEKPCDLLKRKKCLKGNQPCENCYHTSGKCFPSNGSRGDECCAADHELVCYLDMTHDQKMVAYPIYAQYINCALQGHPDKETLKKCIPQQFRESDGDMIFGCQRACQRALECLLRPHNSLESLKICAPNDLNDERQCAEPLPPIEEPPTTAQTPTPKPPVEFPIETGGGGEKPYVSVLDVDNCTNMVKDLCECGQAWCVLRVGYSRTPCCPTDYDLVCCAKKAKAIDLVRMEFEVQGRLNETYETDMPTAITDTELDSTASPDSASTFCLSSTMAIYALSASIAFLLMFNILPR